MTDTIHMTYVGGLPRVAITFPETGRSFEVARGETIELLPLEAYRLEAREDFEPAMPINPNPEETTS